MRWEKGAVMADISHGSDLIWLLTISYWLVAAVLVVLGLSLDEATLATLKLSTPLCMWGGLALFAVGALFAGSLLTNKHPGNDHEADV
jgi:RsiW-degrading membrane proteinase PrsW (M82 family)